MRLSLLPVVLLPPALLAIPAFLREGPADDGGPGLDPSATTVEWTAESPSLEGVRLPAAPLLPQAEGTSTAPVPELALAFWPEWARSMGDWGADRLAVEAGRREVQARALAREVAGPLWDSTRSLPDDGTDPEGAGLVLRRDGRRMLLGEADAPEVFALLEQSRFLAERAQERAAARR